VKGESMEAIKFIDVVREDGLLANPELKRYANQRVEVIVLPIVETNDKMTRFFEKYGKISDETAEEMKRVIRESRTISEPKIL